MDGFNSCYGGPSFQIFLASGKDFVYNDDFTELAQNNCGMLWLMLKTKYIYNDEKLVCWHQYSDYIVENNHPKLIKYTH